MSEKWFDRLRPASFRGIEFEVEGADKEFGPRVIVHEFPLRDDVAQEFIGQLPDSFSIEAIIIADDLTEKMMAFEVALIKQEPGRLVHPWYGELDVVVSGPARVRMSTSEGRVARYSIPFQRAGGKLSPVSTGHTGAGLDLAADATRESSLADFAKTFSIRGQSERVIGKALGALKGVTDEALTSYGLSGYSSFASVGEIGSAVSWLQSAYAGGVAGLASSALGAITSGSLGGAIGIGRQVWGLFGGSSSSASDAPSAYTSPTTASLETATAVPLSGVLMGMASVGDDLPTLAATTPAMSVAAANQKSIVTLAQIGAATESVRAASVEGWESQQAAIAWRDTSLDALGELADKSAALGWSDTWRALVDLRAAVSRDVSTRAAPLPRLSTYEPASTMSATLIAYRFDGDSLKTLFSRSGDIRRRNGLRHPGFVPGGSKLEVLSDG